MTARIDDVARHAGVSIATVSMSLRGRTAAGCGPPDGVDRPRLDG